MNPIRQTEFRTASDVALQIGAFLAFLIGTSALAFFWHTDAVQGFLLMLRAQG